MDAIATLDRWAALLVSAQVALDRGDSTRFLAFVEEAEPLADAIAQGPPLPPTAFGDTLHRMADLLAATEAAAARERDRAGRQLHAEFGAAAEPPGALTGLRLDAIG
ncbi:MAG: hypothetical protein NW201_08360 [Gemmatimonadales bacterium]|nr:hypothetical protein [Gemmatimonadales bacterium]